MFRSVFRVSIKIILKYVYMCVYKHDKGETGGQNEINFFWDTSHITTKKPRFCPALFSRNNKGAHIWPDLFMST